MRDPLRYRRVTAAVLAVAAAVFAVSTAAGSPSGKAFPSGCWIGKSPFSGTYAAGAVKAKVTNGTSTFVLFVGRDKPIAGTAGFWTVTGKGSGTLKVSGSTLALKVKILGDYDLSGPANGVKVNGTYSMTGTATGTGQFLPSIPVKLKFPVKNGALKIVTVSPARVSGLFGNAPWSATRRPGVPSKGADACANAA